MTASAGYAAQLDIGGVRYEFARCMLGAHESVIDANGIVGSRSRDVERVRGGNVHVGGQIEMEPTSLEWSMLLPWLMGGVPLGADISGTSPDFSYALGDQMPVQTIIVDKIAKVFTYANCAVDSFTITGAQGQALKLVIDVVGTTEAAAAAGTFPAGEVIDLTTQPFVFTDAAVLFAATATLIKSYELKVSNHIDRERFFNSTTLAQPPLALDRTTTFRTSIAYDSVLGALVYGTGIAGAAVSVNHTNGAATLNVGMPALVFPREGLEIPGRVEEMLTINGTAYRKALVNELVIASVKGP